MQRIVIVVWGDFSYTLTLNMLNVFKDYKRFTFWIVSWICLVPSKSPEQQNIDGLMQGRRNSSALAMELRLSCTNPSTCCLPYTANTMPTDALATLGARASAGMVLTPASAPKPEYSVTNITRVNISTLPLPSPEYLGRTRSIPLLLMSWLLASPGHQ